MCHKLLWDQLFGRWVHLQIFLAEVPQRGRKIIARLVNPPLMTNEIVGKERESFEGDSLSRLGSHDGLAAEVGLHGSVRLIPRGMFWMIEQRVFPPNPDFRWNALYSKSRSKWRVCKNSKDENHFSGVCPPVFRVRGESPGRYSCKN